MRPHLSPLKHSGIMPTPAHMNTHGKGKHQKRQSDDAPLPVQSLSFRQSLRNVSTCTRCRQRKTRCDQQLPQCGTCEKAGARCVGYDPLMKREVPRSYLYYLEDRVEYFQNLLAEHGVSFEPGSSTMERSQDADPKDSHKRRNSIASTSGTEATVRSAPSASRSPREDLADTGSHLDVDIVRDKHDPGCCTAHELLFALQHWKSLTQSFVLPDRDLAAELITFYFEQGYPQVPALHKGELAQLLNQAYAGAEDNHHYNLFLLYIVFAIGARIMRDRNVGLSENDRPAIGKRKRDTETEVHLAEEYYSAAIAYLSLAFSECDDVSCKLEVIEAAVLIAHLSLFYPIRPGPVYLVGLALRAAVDAKLYDAAGPSLTSASSEGTVSNQDGKQQDQVLQQCRRLWWSAYSLDRLVSPYTGRPFAIPDHLITTAFPSMPEEMGVSCQGISPSNKLMNFLTTHLLQLRQLQSEIHEVLQYHHAQSVRSNSTVVPSTTSILSSPLDYFESFPSFKRDINRRLDEWKSCIPSREETGTWVPIVRLELDYWKTINLLYRHEVKVPSELGRLLPQSHLNATNLPTGEGLTDDFTHFKIVEASRKVLQSYRLVHHLDSGNCTFLATHNIFLAGITSKSSLCQPYTPR